MNIQEVFSELDRRSLLSMQDVTGLLQEISTDPEMLAHLAHQEKELGRLLQFLSSYIQLSANDATHAIRWFARGRRWYLTRIAVDIALRQHRGQGRIKGGLYIAHPYDLWMWLFRHGVRVDVIMALVLLHDVLEDTKMKAEELLVEIKDRLRGIGQDKLFGNAELLVSLVVALTKPEREEDEFDDDYKRKLAEYFAEIAKHPYLIIAKGVDRLLNTRDMQEAYRHERQKRKLEETDTYILPMIIAAQTEYPQFSDVLGALERGLRAHNSAVKISIERQDEVLRLKQLLQEHNIEY